MKFKNLFIGLLIGAVVSLPAAVGFSSDAGTSTDPLVTLSYVDSQIENLRVEMNNLVGQSSNAGYQILENLNEGTRVIFGKNAEVIIRAGGGVVIPGSTGEGFSDLTDGIDLRGGIAIPKNHLLLVARDDGRGIYVSMNQTYIMVKGTYQIKQ